MDVDMGLFEGNDSVFENEDVLRDDYKPKEILERDEQINEYQVFLQNIVGGGGGSNVFAYGQTGVGKTMTTRFVVDELHDSAELSDGVELKTVWINCKGYTSYQVAIEIVNSFREPKNHLSSTGHPESEVYSILWDEIEDCDATNVLFVLDEVDSLSEDDKVLYSLPRARSNGHVDDTYINIIGISNDFKFKDELSDRVRSTLKEEAIQFAPYDANQLNTILYQRSEKAFKEDALADDVVPLTAAEAAQDTGSARLALDILHKAGKLANKNGDTTVTEDHVRDAVGKVEMGVIKDQLRDLSTQSHLVLYALAMLDKSGNAPARRDDIYERYKLIAEQIDAHSKAKRTILNRLNHLQVQGFIYVEEVNRGRAGGKHHRYGLDVDNDLVVMALSESNRFDSIIDDGVQTTL